LNSTVKTILIWILILGAAVALYNFVEKGTGGSPTKLTLTDFMNKLEKDEVKDVTINGSNLKGSPEGKASRGIHLRYSAGLLHDLRQTDE
jgi:hypothetical protein